MSGRRRRYKNRNLVGSTNKGPRASTQRRSNPGRSTAAPKPKPKPKPKPSAWVGQSRQPKKALPRAKAALRAAQRPAYRSPSGRLTSYRNEAVGTATTVSERPFTETKEIEFHRTGANRLPYDSAAENRRDLGTNKAKQSEHAKQKDKIRSAAVRYGLGRALDELPKGSQVTASPTTPGRGRAYARASKGALKPDAAGKIYARKSGKDTWVTKDPKGRVQSKKWNPNELKKPLKEMAGKSALRAVAGRIGGPKVNAALMLDSGAKQLTGKGIGEAVNQIIREELKDKRHSRGMQRRRRERSLPTIPPSFRRR